MVGGAVRPTMELLYQLSYIGLLLKNSGRVRHSEEFFNLHRF